MADPNAWQAQWKDRIDKERRLYAKILHKYYDGALPLRPLDITDTEGCAAECVHGDDFPGRRNVINPPAPKSAGSWSAPSTVARSRLSGAGNAVVQSKLARSAGGPMSRSASGPISRAMPGRPASPAGSELTSVSRRKPQGSAVGSFASLTSSQLHFQVEGLVKAEVERELTRVVEPLKEQLHRERAARLQAEGALAQTRQAKAEARKPA